MPWSRRGSRTRSPWMTRLRRSSSSSSSRWEPPQSGKCYWSAREGTAGVVGWRSVQDTPAAAGGNPPGLSCDLRGEDMTNKVLDIGGQRLRDLSESGVRAHHCPLRPANGPGESQGIEPSPRRPPAHWFPSHGGGAKRASFFVTSYQTAQRPPGLRRVRGGALPSDP
jgi:hypothetical protein